MRRDGLLDFTGFAGHATALALHGSDKVVVKMEPQVAAAPAQRLGRIAVGHHELAHFSMKRGQGFAERLLTGNEQLVLPGGPILMRESGAQGSYASAALALGFDLG
jgi:hypothetical protein